MSTIRDHVIAMGVDPAGLQNTDEYFEVVHSLTVGAAGTTVKDQANIINPANGLQPGDLIQIRRRIGTLAESPLSERYDNVVAADNPVLYLPDAVSFDGAQGKVAHAALNLTGSLSLEAWVNCTGPGTVGGLDYGTIFGYAGNRRLLFVNAAGTKQILAQIGGSNVITPVNSAPLGTRIHVVYTYDGATEKVYIGGAVAASVTTASGPSWTGAFWEGVYSDPSTNYSLKGTLDKRAFYATALPAARVLAHTQAGV